MIAIESISMRYPGASKNALTNVSIAIKAGEFFGLLGPNGGGKTTLISIITGLIKPTSGRVAFDSDKHSYKQVIGLVPQELSLYQSLSLRDNLRFFGSQYGLKGKLLQQRINECIELAQLQEFCDKPIKHYSGGMKRRSNLVISLLHQPKILILDEPTVHVDPQSRQMIFDILAEVNQQGTTIIYTTHYMEEAQKLCQRVAIMDEGEVLALDTPQALIEKDPEAKHLEDVFMHLTGKHLRDAYA